MHGAIRSCGLLIAALVFTTCSAPKAPGGGRADEEDGGRVADPPVTGREGGVADGDPPAGVDDGGGTRDAEPAGPTFPPEIGRLTVTVQTGGGTHDGTDSMYVDLCLTEDDCFSLDNPSYDDFFPGEIDVFHLDAGGLPRSAIDRVEIRTTDGSDAWRPTCLQVAFDGEPVYCNTLDAWFGDDAEAGELVRWSDGEGLHQACQTCWPSALTHGPMVGAVEADLARIWVRTDATRRVDVELRRSDAPGGEPVRATTHPLPERDYTAVLEAPGLVPATSYEYSVLVDGEATGREGSFRTPPPRGEAGHTTFGFGSCSHHAHPQPIFGQIEAAAPDFFLFLGDNHYANSDVLPTLRWHYRFHLAAPERASFLARTPSVAIWDDHDFTGNDTDGTSPGKATSLRAFREHWANPSYGTPEVPGVFTTYGWGDVDVFLLDVRYHRDPACGTASCRTADRGILGPDQTRWLLDALSRSTATFKLIASGSTWSEYQIPDSDDSWCMFVPARDALFAEMASRGIEGVVLLSGDMHRSEFRRIETATGMYPLPELVSSGLSSHPYEYPCQGPDVVACANDSHFFVRVDVDTTRADPTLQAAIVDEHGATRAAWTIRRSELEFL